MVERVVENNAFVLLELHSFVSNSHPGALRAHQRQMAPQFLAGRPVMRRDVRAWGQSTEEAVHVGAGHKLF